MFSLIRKAAIRGVSPLWDIQSCVWAVLIILLLPVIIYLPSLLDWWSIDPIPFVAGVASYRIPTSWPWIDPNVHIAPGWPWIDPNVGFQAQALGKLSADEWLAGRIPWWNYYCGVGFPLAAEAQSGALFLPFVLLNHFSNGTLYIKIVLQMLAGLGTYFLLLKIGLRRFSAVTGAILFEFSGVFAWHGAPIVSPVAFLPWLVLGIEQARENSLSHRSGGSAILAVSLALSIYAGFPETAYIDGLLAGVWALCRLLSVPLEIRYHFIKKVATGVVAGLLISTPLIIPFVEYVGRSYLAGHNADAGFGGVSLDRTHFAQILFPWLFGGIWYYPNTFILFASVGGYLSAAQLTTIILGLLIARRSSLYVVLTLWTAICVARTFGVPVLSTIVNLIPLVKQTAFFRYSQPSWEFCSAVLCAIVINSIFLESFPSRKRAIASLILAGSIATISLYLAHDVVSRLHVNKGYSVFLWASLIWGFGSMALIILVFWIGKDRRFAAISCAIALSVDAIALFSVSTFSAVVGAKTYSAGIKYLKQHIGTDRFYTLGPIRPNYSAYYHIASIDETYMPAAANWTKYLTDHIDPYAYPAAFDGTFPRSSAKEPTQTEVLRQNIAEYEEIGVRYVVCPHSTNPFEPASPEQNEYLPKRVFESDDMDIYELARTKPYFEIDQVDCHLTIESRNSVSVNCASEAQLIRRELYYPGWEAYVSGTKVHIGAYNGVFQAIRVPPGQHKISFNYIPTHKRLIVGSFGLGALWLVIGAIRHLGLDRKKRD